MTEAAHSLFSASAASRWLACPGSLALGQGLKDRPSEYAAEGTVAHKLFEEGINTGVDPAAFLGRVFVQDDFEIEVADDMVEAVRTALRHVTELTAGADLVESERRVNYAQWLGVPPEEGFGTTDLRALFIERRELLVGDYKHGRGVAVDAKDNEQMMLYAGGTLAELESFADIDTIRMVIFQPRVKDAPSEWSISREELEQWLLGRARSGVHSAIHAQRLFAKRDAEWDKTFLNPGAHCKFCRAKSSCASLRNEVARTVSTSPAATPDEFAALETNTLDQELGAEAMYETAVEPWLGACLSKVDMIEDWCKAIRAEAEHRMLAGARVPGFKLVKGKRGNRAWADAEQATKMLRETFRLPLEKAFNLKLISPTQAEKLAKAGEIGPRQWPKAQALITQADGKLHVAPETDDRPAVDVTPVVDEFDTVSQPLVAEAADIC